MDARDQQQIDVPPNRAARARLIRVPLVLRFFFIELVFLVIPIVLITVFMNFRINELWNRKLGETLNFGATSFSSTLQFETRKMQARMSALAKDKDFIRLLTDESEKKQLWARMLLILGSDNEGSWVYMQAGTGLLSPLGRGPLPVQDLINSFDISKIDELVTKIQVDNQGLIITASAAIMDVDTLAGYLFGQRRISRSVFENLRLFSGEELTLLNDSGRQVFTTFSNEYGESLNDGFIHNHDLATGNGTIRTEPFLGKEFYTSLFDIPTIASPRIIGEIAIPSSQVLALNSAESFMIIAALIILMVLLSSFILTKSLLSPVLSLSQGVESLRKHLHQYGPQVSIPVVHNDEVGDLANAVNELGKELRESGDKIAEQRAQIVAYTHSLEIRVQERTRELEEARIRAEIANLHKSKFLVNMNHELRTPLNSITGITDLLRYGAYEKHELIADRLKQLFDLLKCEDLPAIDLLRSVDLIRGFLEEENNGSRVILDVIDRLIESLPPPVNEEAEVRREQMHVLIHESRFHIDEEESQIFKAYQTIRDAGEGLLNIIDEVINLSRIEAGTIVIARNTVVLGDFVANCLVHAEAYARSKGKHHLLQFEKSIAPDVPPRCLFDSQKIKQVLLNLLTNAVKYTDQGSVRCHVDLFDDGKSKTLRFCVHDTGRGIAEEDRDILFMEFGRSFEVREIEGTGLGLALSKRLIEKHGGSIGFSSVIGEGSSFWFMVPLEIAPS